MKTTRPATFGALRYDELQEIIDKTSEIISGTTKWRNRGPAIYIGHKYLASAASELHASEIVSTVNKLIEKL